jgi:hypothetical protein
MAAGTTNAKPTVVRDKAGDAARGELDLVRVALGRGVDGRLRGSLSMSSEWAPADLVANTGPPGSVCLRLWTTTAPKDNPPDFLVCATASADGKTLKASVMRERANDLPQRVASAYVSRPTKRSITLRFSQTSVGRPAKVAFGGETTKAGCPRTTCADTAPDAPATAALTLRAHGARS